MGLPKRLSPLREGDHKTPDRQGWSVQGSNCIGSRAGGLEIEIDPLLEADLLLIVEVKPLLARFLTELLGTGMDVFGGIELGANASLDELKPVIRVMQNIAVIAEGKANPGVLPQPAVVGVVGLVVVLDVEGDLISHAQHFTRLRGIFLVHKDHVNVGCAAQQGLIAGDGSGQIYRDDIVGLTQPSGNVVPCGLGEHFRIDAHENSLIGQGQAFLVGHELQSLADAVDHVLQRLGVSNEIKVVRVDDQQTLLPFCLIDEILISYGELLDVGAFHAAFVRAIAMGNAVHEGIDVGTQEDQQFRLGDFIRQGKVDLVIDIEFIALQVDAGKEGIFIEGVIRNNVPASCQGGRNHLVLMGIAAHQEENLSLEGITLPIGVKTPEKGIFFKDFQQQISLKGFMN